MAHIPLHVLMDGKHLGMVGSEPRRSRLVYDSDADAALSLSMPLSKRRWGPPVVGNWLSALLPDREPTLARWRAEFGVTDHNPEALIPFVGEDVAGAAQFVREDRLEIVTQRRGQLTSVGELEIGQLLRRALADLLPIDAAASLGHFSLAGAQAKLALAKLPDGAWAVPSGAEPSTHILKPAMPGLVDQDVAEALAMRTAARLGLAVAPVTISCFGDMRALVVERFDRRWDGTRWRRDHSEDLCQAMGLSPIRKYETQAGPGVAQCCAFLSDHFGEGDVRRFAQAVIFNHLTRGSDAHARNYSIVWDSAGATLAPLYDLNPTLAYPQLGAVNAAMRVGGEFRFDRVGSLNWSGFAADAGLDDGWVRDEVTRLANGLPDAISDACRDEDLRPFTGRLGLAMTDAAASWCEIVKSKAGARGR